MAHNGPAGILAALRRCLIIFHLCVLNMPGSLRRMPAGGYLEDSHVEFPLQADMLRAFALVVFPGVEGFQNG